MHQKMMLLRLRLIHCRRRKLLFYWLIVDSSQIIIYNIFFLFVMKYNVSIDKINLFFLLTKEEKSIATVKIRMSEFVVKNSVLAVFKIAGFFKWLFRVLKFIIVCLLIRFLKIKQHLTDKTIGKKILLKNQ